MNSGDRVKINGHPAKVIRVQGKEVVIVWDAGGYGRVPIEKIEAP